MDKPIRLCITSMLLTAISLGCSGPTSHPASQPKDQAILEAPKVDEPPDGPFPPDEVAAGAFERWQAAAREPKKGLRTTYTYTLVKYAGKAFWVMDIHFGNGEAYKKLAIYAPVKDGSFRRCLLADSNVAFALAASVDHKTGVLELREEAGTRIEGKVVLSCNLKTIGTPYSTDIE